MKLVILPSPKEQVSMRPDVRDGFTQRLDLGDRVFWKREHLATGNCSTLRENSLKLAAQLRKLSSHEAAAEVQVEEEAHENHAHHAMSNRRNAILVTLAHVVSHLSS